MSDRIDFSSLDPKRQPRRFEAMVQATLARIEAAPLPQTPAAALSAGLAKLRWGAVVFAACAALAWVPALLSAPSSPAPAGVTAARADSPAVLVLHGADAVAVLEAFDDR